MSLGKILWVSEQPGIPGNAPQFGEGFKERRMLSPWELRCQVGVRMWQHSLLRLIRHIHRTLNDELNFLSPAVTLSWIWELFPQMFDSPKGEKKRYLKTRVFPSSLRKHGFVCVFTAVVSSSQHSA